MKPETIDELRELITNTLNKDRIGLFEDIIYESKIFNKTEDEALINYTNTLSEYFYWLRVAEQQEDYLLCQQILRCIEIEEKAMITVIKDFTNWYSNEVVIQIKDIRAEFNNLYNSTDED